MTLIRYSNVVENSMNQKQRILKKNSNSRHLFQICPENFNLSQILGKKGDDIDLYNYAHLLGC